MPAWGKWLGVLAVIILVVLGFRAVKKPASPAPAEEPLYEMVNASDGSIEKIASGLGPVTRIKFTPDGKHLLVAVLSGDILAFNRQADGSWQKQANPVVSIQTSFPGFPPEENGVTGLAIGADYATSGDVFFTYAFKKSEEETLNRVARATIKEEAGQLVGSGLADIFEANVPASSSHQIQAINGIMVEAKPHVIFQMGEGFEATRANDLTKEGGKVMLIQRDGSNPLGPRPFAGQPKIQATGLRNPPDMEINNLDPLKRIGIVDTGPGRFDRFIYAKLIDLASGKKVKGLELGWNGSEVPSLSDPRPDPNTSGVTDSVVYRWDPTHTATNLVFHPGKGAIPKSTDSQTSVLVSLFGPTGEKGLNEDGSKKPGREIWLGTLKLAGQPTVDWKPFIRLTEKGIDTLTHPIGLERDPETNDLLFADIISGALYQVKIND